MSHKKDNPGFVRTEDCVTFRAEDRERSRKIELALFGEDFRGGMVKDMTCIRAKVDMATSVVRSVVIPFVVPLILAGVFYALGKWGGV